MSATERLGAFEGLQSSILILRANWELILLSVAQTVLAVGLGIASLVPFSLVLDLTSPALDATPEESAAWLAESFVRIVEQIDSPALWLALISSSAILLALLVCYSFFQAGIFGTLTGADRRASSPATGTSASLRVYRWSGFQVLGGHFLWRFFWLFNLVLLVWLLWSLLAALALVAVGVAAGGAGFGAGLAVGCASLFPLGFLVVVLLFWTLFAQAMVAATECGPWEALRAGLVLVVRRLGAVVLLFLVLAFVSVAIAMFFLVLSLPLGGAWSIGSGVWLAVTIVLQSLHWLVTGILHLTIAGAVVAIVGGEGVPEAGEEGQRVAVAT